MTPASWIPDRPISQGASAYHSAVAKTSWHRRNIKETLKLVKRKIRSSQIIVDFGAGTGASSTYTWETLPRNCKLLLVDNSPSWLGKAYEILHKKKNVTFYLLKKKKDQYEKLDQALGREAVDHVICANKVHLIPDINQTFLGIYTSLKSGGSFVFQSGNIKHVKSKDMMMIEDSVRRIHDLAIKIIRTDPKFALYKQTITKRIQEEKKQRKFVFPDPRSISFYTNSLKETGFKNISVTYVPIKVLYSDWLSFVRVRRLQAGILPELGGKNPSPIEERDRDFIITKATKQLFEILKKTNALATNRSFSAEWTYVQAEK